MEKLVIKNCINFQREQIDVETAPCAGNCSMLPFTCSTLESTMQRPVNVQVQTDEKGYTSANCQETETCKKLQTHYD